MTLTRRALFKGMGASLLMAPSIVRASSLDYVPRERHHEAWRYLGDGTWSLSDIELDHGIPYPERAKRLLVNNVKIRSKDACMYPWRLRYGGARGVLHTEGLGESEFIRCDFYGEAEYCAYVDVGRSVHTAGERRFTGLTPPLPRA